MDDSAEFVALILFAILWICAIGTCSSLDRIADSLENIEEHYETIQADSSSGQRWQEQP